MVGWGDPYLVVYEFDMFTLSVSLGLRLGTTSRFLTDPPVGGRSMRVLEHGMSDGSCLTMTMDILERSVGGTTSTENKDKR